MKKAATVSLLLILFVLTALCDDKDFLSSDLPDLIEDINKATNNNWLVVSANRGHLYLRYKKEIMGFEHYKSSPGQREPKIVYHEFYLDITPKISVEKYDEHKKETKKNYEDLLKKALNQIKHEQMKGSYDFQPNSKSEWTLYLKYLKAEQDYFNLPKYYYKNIGINCKEYKSTWTNEKDKDQENILKIAEEQQQVILSLLTKYE